MDTPFMPAELYLIKLTASHLSTLNKKIANQNMLKTILIAMHNENKLNAADHEVSWCPHHYQVLPIW